MVVALPGVDVNAVDGPSSSVDSDIVLFNGTTGKLIKDSGQTIAQALAPYVLQTTTIATTAPLTGGGALSGNLTLAIPKATSSVDGYLFHTDWSTFNSKQNALTIGNFTEATSSVLTIVGGTGAIIGSGLTVQVKQSSASVSGYLSSTDWSTFNSKQAALSFGNLTEATSSIFTITGGAGAVIGSGTSLKANLTNAQIYVGNASNVAAGVALSGDATITNTGVITVANSAITNAKLANMNAHTVKANATGSAAAPTDVSTGTVTEATSSVLTLTGWSNATIGSPTIQVAQSSGSVSGYLSNTDWTTFNNKQNALSFGNLTESTSSILTITGGTGAVIGSGVTLKHNLTSAQIYVGNASNVAAGVALSGDATITNAGVLTVANSAITNAKLANMNSHTVKANATGSAAAPTDVSTGTVTEATSSVLTLTGWTNATIGSPTIQVAQASGSVSGYLSSTDWTTFNGKQNALSFGNLTESTSSIFTITGGTGAVIGSGTSIKANLTSGDFYVGNASNVAAAVAMSGDATLANTGAITIAANAVTNAKLATMTAHTVKANATGSSATPTDVATGTVTEATSSVLTLTGWSNATIGSPTIQVTKADTSHSGYLSSTDWNTFNGKVSGPGSSTDRAIATWNGAGGATLRNNSVTIDSSSNMAGIAKLTMAGLLTDTLGASDQQAIVIDGNTNPYSTTVGASDELTFFNCTRTLSSTSSIATNAFDTTTSNPLNMTWEDDRTFGFGTSTNASLTSDTANVIMIQGTKTLNYTTATTPTITLFNTGMSISDETTTVWNGNNQMSTQTIADQGAYLNAQITATVNDANVSATVQGFEINALHFCGGSGGSFTNELTAVTASVLQFDFGFGGTFSADGTGIDLTVAGHLNHAYGVYLTNIQGSVAAWGFYNGASGTDNWLTQDDSHNYMGTSMDAFIMRESANSCLTIKANAVTSTDYIKLDSYVRAAALKSGTTQGGAGAVAGELWVNTSTNVVLRGV